MYFHSLRFKIILSCAVCIIIAGVASNMLLHLYMTSIISEKADSIDRLNLQSAQNSLNQTLYQFELLGDLCANDTDISRAMRNRELSSLSAKREAMRAYEALRRYLSASNIERYIVKLIAFNEYGLMTQAASNNYSVFNDLDRVRESPMFAEQVSGGANRTIAITPSISTGTNCIALISPVYDNTASDYKGWIYVEMDLNGLSENTMQSGDNRFFITESEERILTSKDILPKPFLTRSLSDGMSVRDENDVYILHSAPLRLAGLTVFSYSDMTYLTYGGRPILYTTTVVIIISLVSAIMLAVLLSSIITRPLGRLMTRIEKIAGNDFSFDPGIEHGGDEIARTGKMLNEMTVSFSNLLSMTEEMYTRQKNADIALLQSQVNPHFLYNTLDSIHWMATIQKNTAIMTMTKSLSTLLRNLAKGVNDKITLNEELSLVQDYINIQSLRYIGSFTYTDRVPECFRSCPIVKFMLQPLVENAIFHGVEPKGINGSITVDATEEDNFLLITVRDNGVGMTSEELDKINTEKSVSWKGRFSGMGVQNVHERLRLIYGSQCGLTYNSEKDVFTEVTVRIPKDVMKFE